MSDKALLKNMSWLTLVTGIERGASVLQTVLVARVLGITEYGMYGLLFGTIGFTASMTGLHMGATATVYVARYRDTEKTKAAYVVQFVNRLGLTLGLIFLLATLPFAAPIAAWLTGSLASGTVIMTGCLLVALAVISGVQDGIIQGFEDFRSVAIIRLASTFVTLASIYPAGRRWGLVGVMSVILLGQAVQYLFLTYKIHQHCRQQKLPAKGEGLRGRDLMWGFGLPSMLASLMVGAISWGGTFMLSRESNGFDALAVVNTGTQWRGPIFLFTSSIASVAVPAMSRYFQAANHAAIEAIQSKILLFNGGFSLLASMVLMALSPWILKLYGNGFEEGILVFSLVILSAVPQVVSGVYLQNLMAKGQMWRQFFLHLWLAIPLLVGFTTLIPLYHSQGFAIANLIGYGIFAVAVALKAKLSTT